MTIFESWTIEGIISFFVMLFSFLITATSFSIKYYRDNKIRASKYTEDMLERDRVSEERNRKIDDNAKSIERLFVKSRENEKEIKKIHENNTTLEKDFALMKQGIEFIKEGIENINKKLDKEPRK